MVIPWLPLVVSLGGLLAFALASNTKVVELGRLSYVAGVLVLLAVLARLTVRV